MVTKSLTPSPIGRFLRIRYSCVELKVSWSSLRRTLFCICGKANKWAACRLCSIKTVYVVVLKLQCNKDNFPFKIIFYNNFGLNKLLKIVAQNIRSNCLLLTSSPNFLQLWIYLLDNPYLGFSAFSVGSRWYLEYQGFRQAAELELVVWYVLIPKWSIVTPIK